MPAGKHLGVAAALAVVMSMSVAGCDRVVSITVPESAQQLVVEGRVEVVQGETTSRQMIILATTGPFFQNTFTPPARGALVAIMDGDGRSVALRESQTEPGHYVTDSLVAKVGGRYTLHIRWAGDDYEAIDTLFAVAPIDSLYLEPRNTAGVGPQSGSTRPGLRATIDMRDPPDVPNYYLWDMFVNGTRISALSDTAARLRAVDSDQFYNGLRVRGTQPHAGTELLSGQQILVRQQSISAQQYRYYKALNDQVSGDGSPFSVPPNSVRGNVANRTRPDVRALGYFMATHVSERQLRVP